MRIAGRNLRVGSIVFRVKRRKMHDYGECRLDKQAITIGHKVTTPDLARLTLLHEAVHAILEANGMIAESENERLVEVISHGVIDLLRDNPWLAQMMMEGLPNE